MARMGRPPTPAIKRFTPRTRIIPETGCIEWTGTIDKYGYGQFVGSGGREVRANGAHRWSYEYFVGSIPDGYQIDHLCRNRKCVNPSHLEAVTPRVNVLRSLGPSAINARKTHCLRGHELNPGNTYVSGKGSRSCVECVRLAARKSYLKNRDKVLARGAARKAEQRRQRDEKNGKAN